MYWSRFPGFSNALDKAGPWYSDPDWISLADSESACSSPAPAGRYRLKPGAGSSPEKGHRFPSLSRSHRTPLLIVGKPTGSERRLGKFVARVAASLPRDGFDPPPIDSAAVEALFGWYPG